MLVMLRDRLTFEPFADPTRPLIVVSAVAFVTGGPLTILRRAVAAARDAQANVLFLVADHRDWEPGTNIRFVGFPRARHSYLERIWTEYVLMPRLSRRWRPDAWLSLHDTSPPVRAGRQAVYMQNSLPYWRPTMRDLFLDPFEVLRSLIYGVVYRAFVSRNDLVIGQLRWFTRFMGTYLGVPDDRLLVVLPEADRVKSTAHRTADGDRRGSVLRCVYPSLPRVFKNFEEAIELCDQPGVELTLTISGAENRYAGHVADRARGKDVRFVGLLTHDVVLDAMAAADVVLFPSRLETFGLPIREAMDLERALVLPVRPWTVEIAADYPRAYFYRSVEEGRRIVSEIARGREPTELPHPKPTSGSELPTLTGFRALFDRLVGAY
jgi:glycosyltransferase involved in cell wall biosynthesis